MVHVANARRRGGNVVSHELLESGWPFADVVPDSARTGERTVFRTTRRGGQPERSLGVLIRFLRAAVSHRWSPAWERLQIRPISSQECGMPSPAEQLPHETGRTCWLPLDLYG